MNKNQIKLDKFRLYGFSDAVFAIAITLLVLDLNLPENSKNLLSKLQDISPNLIAFLISFLIIGLYWLNHNSMFSNITKYTKKLFKYNLFFLFFITLLPFSTSILSEKGDSPEAVLVYALNLVFLGITLFILWNYAEKNNLINTDLNKKYLKRKTISLLVSPTIFLISIPLAYIFSPTVGELFWLANIFSTKLIYLILKI